VVGLWLCVRPGDPRCPDWHTPSGGRGPGPGRADRPVRPARHAVAGPQTTRPWRFRPGGAARHRGCAGRRWWYARGAVGRTRPRSWRRYCCGRTGAAASAG